MSEAIQLKFTVVEKTRKKVEAEELAKELEEEELLGTNCNYMKIELKV